MVRIPVLLLRVVAVAVAVIAVAAVVADVVVVAVAVFQLLLPQAGRSLVRIPVLVLLL